MAQVAVTDTSIGSADANLLDISHIVASGESLFVAVVLEVTDAAKEVLSVTWDQGGGDQAALSLFAAFSPTHNQERIEIWQLATPVAKTATIRTVIEDSNTQKFGVVAVSTTNTDQITPLKGAVTMETASAASGSVAPTQNADDLAFIIAAQGTTGGTFSPGSGESEHEDFIAASTFGVWAASEDGSGVTTLSWTWSGSASTNASMGFVIAAGPAADVTGTATATIDETDVRAGADTLLLTLTNETWVAVGGTFDAIRQDIIDGLDSAQVEGTGWNAEVRDKQTVGGVVRTSDTLVTITLDAQAAYNITAQETIEVTVPGSAVSSGNPITGSPTFTVDVLAGTAAVTGTAEPTSTEAQIVAGGRTIIITLSDDTWVAAGGTFDAIRQDIIDGLDSAQSELTGWNAEVRDKQLVAGVVRTSPTVVTITLDAQAAYDITDTETITVTVPASALFQSAIPITATPTFTVTEIPTAVLTGTAVPSSTEAQIVSGGRTIIITLTDDEWVAAGATFNAIRQDIIDGLDSAQSELTGWNNEVRDNLPVGQVTRTSPTVVTITLSAQGGYNITDTETITVTVPASALNETAAPLTATPTFTVTEIPTAVLTGTAVPTSAEEQIRAGARTIIITLMDDEWVASGATFNAVRQAIIDGLDSAQSELTGWNNEVRDKEVVTAVVRTNATVVTITLTAQAAYDITADETITVTVPASALDQTALPITATPTVLVISVAPIPGPTEPDPFESIAGNGLGGVSRNHTPPGVIVNR